MTPEGKELATVIKGVKSRKLQYIRLVFRPGLAAGWPDLLVLGPMGISVFVEMKRAGKEPTDLQRVKLDTLNTLGHFNGWFDNAADALSYIDAIFSTLAGEVRKAAAP